MRTQGGAALLRGLVGVVSGALVGWSAGFFLGLIWVELQGRGDGNPVEGEWSALVVVIVCFWGAIVGAIVFGLAAGVKEWQRLERFRRSLPPPPPSRR